MVKGLSQGSRYEASLQTVPVVKSCGEEFAVLEQQLACLKSSFGIVLVAVARKTINCFHVVCASKREEHLDKGWGNTERRVGRFDLLAKLDGLDEECEVSQFDDSQLVRCLNNLAQ